MRMSRRSPRIDPKRFIRLKRSDDLFCTGHSVPSLAYSHVVHLNINEIPHNALCRCAPAKLTRGLKKIAVILIRERLAVCVMPRLPISQKPDWVPLGPANIPQS